MELKLLDDRLDPAWFQPQTDGSAGIDLYCCTPCPMVAAPNVPIKVPLGISVAIPAGYVGLLMPRSSAGVKGFALANTVGVIDSDYRGELTAMAINTLERTRLKISPMDRLFQLVVVPHWDYAGTVRVVDELTPTDRGAGGFGSTGV